MIAITFRDFYNERYNEPDDGYSIYVIKDGETALYVGMSRVSVYGRWFGFGGHMMHGKGGYPVAVSDTISQRIETNYPESADWIIELWTVSDCIEFLSLYQDVALLHRMKQRQTENVEAAMIKQLKPLYNAKLSGSNGYHLPRTEKERVEFKEMTDAYNKIFNK